MRQLILICTALLAMAGCSSSTLVPLDLIDRANEVCKNLDGVKRVQVTTYLENPKLFSGRYITDVQVTCLKHNATAKFNIIWKPHY